MRPDRQLGALLQDLRAAGKKRSHRQCQHLVEDSVVRRLMLDVRIRADWRGGVLLRSRPIPLADDVQQRNVTPERLDSLAIGVFERTEPAHDVGRLAYGQSEIRQLERNVFEAQQWARLGLVARKNIGTQLERGQRDPRLHTSLHFKEFEVHVDRIGQLGLAFSQRTELDRFVCVWTAGASWASCGIGHSADHTGTGDRGLNRAASSDSASVEVAMRILMVASEAAPFAKTGGLADVVAALPRALARLGHSVDVVIPRYRGITAGEHVARVTVPLGGQVSDATVYAMSEGGVRTIFVSHAGYFDRDYLYGAVGHDYPDNPERFAFLSRAALEWAASSGERYDAIHAHDWQAGLVPVFLRQLRAPVFRGVPTVFTIHNVAYQGVFDASWLPRLGLGWELMNVNALEYWNRISFLKGGIVFSRLLTTVSPRYAREIQTLEYGSGFDGIFRSRSADLVGIRNGIDYDQWDPARDPYLPEPFDATCLDGKAAAKRMVLEMFGLPASEKSRIRPLVGMISRLVDQKGFDLLAELGDELTRLDASFVLLGTGERRYEDLWLALAARYPECIATKITFDEAMAHRIEGGADIFLMPSRFEPCGLNQMYSLRYGTVPLVRATGGLYDTVRNRNSTTGSGTGFTFDEYSPQALLSTLRRALGVYEDRAAWRRMQIAGMQEDFSWDTSAREYVKMYERAGSGSSVAE